MTNHHLVYEILSDAGSAMIHHDGIPLSEYSPVVRWFSVLSGALPVTEIRGKITAYLDGEE